MCVLGSATTSLSHASVVLEHFGWASSSARGGLGPGGIREALQKEKGRGKGLGESELASLSCRSTNETIKGSSRGHKGAGS